MATSNVSAIDQDTWQLISSATPTASASSHSFSSISGYKTLMLAYKKVGTGAAANLYLRFNGDSTDRGYSGLANGYYDAGYFTTTGLGITGESTTENSGYVVINNANSTNMFKTIQEGASFVTNKYGLIWLNNTDAISSVVIHTSTSTFSGTGTFYLYGIAG
jgi:hypothetical protein